MREVVLVLMVIGGMYVAVIYEGKNNSSDDTYFEKFHEEFGRANLMYWQHAAKGNVDSANYYDGQRKAFYEAEDFVYKQMYNK